MSLSLVFLVPILAVMPASIDAGVLATDTVGGPTFVALTDAVDDMLAPIDDFAAQMSGLIDADASDTANTVAGDAVQLWNYLSYGSDIMPNLLSISVLITLFVVVMLVKLIMSLVKYIKQLVAQWV